MTKTSIHPSHVNLQQTESIPQQAMKQLTKVNV